jgi:DNA-binding transcriptional LysR family regulator
MAEWPDLAAVEALVAVADHGSLAAAARGIGMAQPNVSRSIARLERRYALPLIHRSTTGATLTAQGLVVVEWSRDLLSAARRLTDGVIALGEGPGTLALAASHTVAEHLVPGWVAMLRKDHPDLRIRAEVCNSAEVVAQLMRGEGDVGFIEGPDAPRGLNHRVVGHDELLLVVPPGHPLTRRRTPLRITELVNWPLVTREPGSGTRVALDQALGRRGLPPVVPVQEAASNATVRVAVASGAGLAVLSGLAVASMIDAGTLVSVPLEGTLRRDLRAVWPGPARPAGPVADLIAIAAGRTRRRPGKGEHRS